MRRKTFLISLAVSFMFIACSEENVSTPGGSGDATTPGEEVTDSAVVLKANINGLKYSNTRATSGGNWENLEDTLVAIKIGDEVKNYGVDEEGLLTCNEPFYWGDNDKLTIEGWYPYNDGEKPAKVSVKSDQSVEENFQASDFLEALPAEIEKVYPRISFTHRVSKVIFSISVENGTSQGAELKIMNLVGVENGNEVTPNDENTALIAPQTIQEGTEFLNINLLSGVSAVYEADKEFIFEQGYIYFVDVKISEVGGVTAEIADTVPWTGEDIDLPGESSEVNPDTDDNGWSGGDDENLNGESSNVSSPGITAPGWNTDGESTELPATKDSSNQ